MLSTPVQNVLEAARAGETVRVARRRHDFIVRLPPCTPSCDDASSGA